MEIRGDIMKKIVSILLIALMGLLLLTSCGATADKEKNASTIIANYSIKNADDDKNFIVEVQDLGGVYKDLYDRTDCMSSLSAARIKFMMPTAKN